MKVKAIATVSVMITLQDTFSEECRIDQVFSQASAKARNIISQHLATIPNVDVPKEVQIEVVLVEKEEKSQ